MPQVQEGLTEKFEAACREPELILEVSQTWSLGEGMLPSLQLLKPGPTPRSRPVKLCPVLLGEHEQTAADLLEQLAAVMRQAGRRT